MKIIKNHSSSGVSIDIKEIPQKELEKILCVLRFSVKRALELTKLSKEKGIEYFKDICEMTGNTEVLTYNQEKLESLYNQEMEIAHAVVHFVNVLAENGICVPEIE